MKIRLIKAGDYKELGNVQFPVEVEVDAFSQDRRAFFVSQATISKLPGCHKAEEEFYCFFIGEVQIVEESNAVDRKATLLQLITQYGEAAKDASDMGNFDGLSYAICKAEEDRLLEEITKMINDGV